MNYENNLEIILFLHLFVWQEEGIFLEMNYNIGSDC